MKISKKCQYALKAVFELAWRDSFKPVKTHDIAIAQGISVRFAENILNELKHGGFVVSKRGNEGGYMLAMDPKELTVRDIIEYIEGPISIAPGTGNGDADKIFPGNEALAGLWGQVNEAISEVCQRKTFTNLVDFERVKRDKGVLSYAI